MFTNLSYANHQLAGSAISRRIDWVPPPLTRSSTGRHRLQTEISCSNVSTVRGTAVHITYYCVGDPACRRMCRGERQESASL